MLGELEERGYVLSIPARDHIIIIMIILLLIIIIIKINNNNISYKALFSNQI